MSRENWGESKKGKGAGRGWGSSLPAPSLFCSRPKFRATSIFACTRHIALPSHGNACYAGYIYLNQRLILYKADTARLNAAIHFTARRTLAYSRRSVSGEQREKRGAKNDGAGMGRKRRSPLAIFPLTVRHTIPNFALFPTNRTPGTG